MPTNRENGSITAELVISLPAVGMVIALAIGAISLQLERMEMISLGAEITRAVARGEDEATIEKLISSLGEAAVEITEVDLFICVELVKSVKLLNTSSEIFELRERQCARSAGR